MTTAAEVEALPTVALYSRLPDPVLLTPAQVAHYLPITYATVRKWLSRGRLNRDEHGLVDLRHAAALLIERDTRGRQPMHPIH